MNSKKTPNQKTQVLKLYTQLKRATNSVTNKINKHLINHKLSISQFGVMEALYRCGPLCQKEIEEKVHKTRKNLTQAMDTLEKRGIVTREKDPNDGRKITMKITRSGLELIEKIFPYHSKIAHKVCSVFEPNGQQSLSKILKKLNKKYQGHHK